MTKKELREQSKADLQKLVDPVNYLGQSEAFVDRVLTQHRLRKH